MSEIVSSETYEETLVVADDGDPRSAAITAAALQGLLNNTGANRLRIATIEVPWLQRTARPALDLTDADHTVNVSSANVFVLADNPTAVRTITCVQAGVADDSVQRFVLKRGNSPYYYRIKRAGSADYICDVAGYYSGPTYVPCSVELQLRSGVWRVTGACQGIIMGADA